MSKLSSLSPPRRRVEKGRDWHRWTRNSLLRTIKPFLAEFPAALDHGIDICVAVHVCRHENVEVPGNLTLLTYTYDGPFNAWPRTAITRAIQLYIYRMGVYLYCCTCLWLERPVIDGRERNLHNVHCCSGSISETSAFGTPKTRNSDLPWKSVPTTYRNCRWNFKINANNPLFLEIIGKKCSPVNEWATCGNLHIW